MNGPRATDLTAVARRAIAGVQGCDGLVQLMLLARHHGDPETTHLGYCDRSGCHYGAGLAGLPPPEQAFVVAHETLHDRLSHVARGCALEHGGGFSWRVWNLATDALVNGLLLGLPAGVVRPPCGFAIIRLPTLTRELEALAAMAGVLPPTVADMATVEAEQLYRECMRILRAAGGALGYEPEAVLNTRLPLPDDIGPGRADGPLPEIKQDIREREQQWQIVTGGLPAGDRLHALRRSAGRRNPWPQVLKQSLRRVKALAARDTLRPSRRMLSALSLPGRGPSVVEARTAWHRRSAKVMVYVDTSASIGTDLMSRFLGEVAAIARDEAIDAELVYVDSAVRAAVALDRRGRPTAAPPSGGGTDFRPAFKHALAAGPDAVVYLTDLKGPLPARREWPFEIIWAHPRTACVEPPFGRSLEIA